MFGGVVVSFPPLSPPCVVVYTLIIKGGDLQKIIKLLPPMTFQLFLYSIPPTKRVPEIFSLFIVGGYLYIPIGIVDIMCSKT